MAQENIDKNITILEASESFILYPSLTAPALVRGSGELNIIIAADSVLYSYCKDHSPGFDAEKEVKELSDVVLRFIHSHLVLVKWRDTVGEPKDIDKTTHLTDVEAGLVRFAKGHARHSEMKELSGEKNMIYAQEGHNAPINRAGCTCKGWYLGALDSSSDTIMYNRKDKNDPFGIIAASAARFLLLKQRSHIFQVVFSDIPAFTDVDAQAKEMCELLWLAQKVENGVKRIFNPTEEAFQELFASAVAKGGEPRADSLLAPAVPPDDSGEAESARCAHAFALFSTGGNTQGQNELPETPEGNIKKIAATLQGGRLLAPRHPVFWSNKKRLNLNLIADPHISSRQGIYKTVGARLIDGISSSLDIGEGERTKDKYAAPITKASRVESPLIGWMAHEYLQSTVELFANTPADAVAFLGDMYDHIRNCSPVAYHDRSNGKWGKTGYLWEAMSFKSRYESDYDLYPRFIDGLLALELILQSYARKVPVMFSAGNHEGYENPYGVSPRVGGEKHGAKGNEGIPLDHNLTFMEIIHLFGPSYHEHHGSGNFKGFNFDWLYTTLSPWKDVFITYGGVPKGAVKGTLPEGEQNFVVLDWGRGEKYFTNIVMGDTLPVAKDAIQSTQLELIKKAGERHKKDGSVTNLLLSHFTFAGYTRSKPLYGEHFGKNSLPLPDTKEKAKIVKDYPLKDGVSLDTGTFEDKQNAVWKIVTEHFKATLSGHTHKAGIYEISFQEARDERNRKSYFRYIEPFFTTELLEKKEGNQAISLPPNAGVTYSLVSGSCGSYNKQNLFGELGGYGIEKPQSMVLSFDEASGDPNDVTIFRSKTCRKPKLAVTMDYLWEKNETRMFQSIEYTFRHRNAMQCRGGLNATTLEGIILSPGKGKPLVFRCAKNLLRYFRASAPDDAQQHAAGQAQTGKSSWIPLPGKTIKIHAVFYTKGVPPQHVGCLNLKVAKIDEDSFASSRNGVVFELSGSDETLISFINYCEKENSREIDSFQFVLSYAFDNTNAFKSGGVDFNNYDTVTPWSFPVQIIVDKESGVARIVRHSEIPDFAFLSRNYPEEYLRVPPSIIMHKT